MLTPDIKSNPMFTWTLEVWRGVTRRRDPPPQCGNQAMRWMKHMAWAPVQAYPRITQSQIIILTYPGICTSGYLIPIYPWICKSRHLILTYPGLSQSMFSIQGYSGLSWLAQQQWRFSRWQVLEFKVWVLVGCCSHLEQNLCFVSSVTDRGQHTVI